MTPEIKQAVWNEAGDGYEIAITNTLILTQATVTKKLGRRRDRGTAGRGGSARFPSRCGCCKNGEPYETGNPGGEVTLTADDDWTHTWTGLPKFDADGKEYIYTVVETDIPDGYTVRYDTAQPGEETPDAQAPRRCAPKAKTPNRPRRPRKALSSRSPTPCTGRSRLYGKESLLWRHRQSVYL